MLPSTRGTSVYPDHRLSHLYVLRRPGHGPRPSRIGRSPVAGRVRFSTTSSLLVGLVALVSGGSDRQHRVLWIKSDRRLDLRAIRHPRLFHLRRLLLWPVLRTLRPGLGRSGLFAVQGITWGSIITAHPCGAAGVSRHIILFDFSYLSPLYPVDVTTLQGSSHSSIRWDDEPNRTGKQAGGELIESPDEGPTHGRRPTCKAGTWGEQVVNEGRPGEGEGGNLEEQR